LLFFQSAISIKFVQLNFYEMKYIFLFLVLGCFSCTAEKTTDAAAAELKAEELIVRNGNSYTEYYPGKKHIKIEGMYDDAEQRHGVWKFYMSTGLLGSMTEYNHGKRNGISIVNFPNGANSYRGEYKDDKPSGVWKFFDQKTGKLKLEKDYDKK
jgi:antitoxin component YwqK of YwqJK toxin-antitoxin module